MNSTEDSDIQWVLGLNYFHSSYTYDWNAASAILATLNGDMRNRIDSHTFAAFGDVTVPLGERWKISGGLRLAYERQTLDADYTGNG